MFWIGWHVFIQTVNLWTNTLQIGFIESVQYKVGFIKIIFIVQYCVIKVFFLLRNTVQIDISCYCTIQWNWRFLAIVQYCGIVQYSAVRYCLLYHITVQWQIFCFCALLCNWWFFAITQYCASVDFLLLRNTVL